MKRLHILIFILFTISCSTNPNPYTEEIIDGVRYVHNLSPLWGDEQKLSLEFVQKIGELESSDENYQLFKPFDVAEDNNGNIYILDRGNKRVQKFNSKGIFISTIGGPGQGPDEFDLPGDLEIDSKGNILVSDLNSKIKQLSPSGKYKSSYSLKLGPQSFHFKTLLNGNVVFLSMPYSSSAEENYKILTVINTKGNHISEFCEPEKYSNRAIETQANIADFSTDRNDNIIISFYFQNRIEKYSQDGMIIFKSDRKLDYPISYKEEEYEVEGQTFAYPAFTDVSIGLGIDSNDRIWILTFKKQPEKEEKRTDYLRYEVFNKTGILLTRVSIPDHVFDHVEQIGNHIYFIDPYYEMAVFQYRIIEN